MEPVERSQAARLHRFRQEHDEYVICILDACRYDSLYKFIERSDFYDVDVERLYSPARHSQEWGITCWKGDYDVTYVTGNVWLSGRGQEISGVSFDLEEHVKKVVDMTETVGEPHDIVSGVLGNEDDKMAAHFMQPHCPYVGDYELEGATAESTPWWKWMKAYLRNLELVWYHGVEPLLHHFDSRPVVVTSDHGELFELDRVYHDYGYHDDDVMFVPWIEFEPDDERRGYDMSQVRDPQDEELESRLRDLGYME